MRASASPPTERQVVEPRVGRDVRDSDRAALPEREIRRGQPRRHLGGERLDSLRVPLGRERLAVLAREPDEAARRGEHLPDLAHRRLEDGAHVALGADAPRELGDEPLPLERLRERVGRARAVERERGLRRERLHQRELLAAEDALLVRGRGDEHPDDALARHEGHEDAALRASGASASRRLTLAEPGMS